MKLFKTNFGNELALNAAILTILIIQNVQNANLIIIINNLNKI